MNFYSVCTIGLAGIFGFSGIAQALGSCATVDANLNANLPCVAVADNFYQVNLNHSVNPNDLWNLGSYTTTTDNGSCSTVDLDYNVTIPCVSAGGSDYKVELTRHYNSDNPSNFEWTLGPVEFIGATGSPRFDGVIFSVANNIDQITIAWLDATDDKTPASEIKYNIYLSDTPDYTPSSSTFLQSVTGVKQAEIFGLTAGKTYYIRVIAIDGDGLMSSGEKYVTVTTLLNPITLSDTVPLLVAEKNALATPTIVGTDYRFPYTGTETPPAEGSIVVGNDGSGGYLRKVVKSTIAEKEIIVQTTDGSLTDAVTQGSIKSALTLFDNPNSLNSTITPFAKKALKSIDIASIPSSSPNSSNKSEWQNNLLKFEEIVNPTKQTGLLIQKNSLSNRYLISTTTPNAHDRQAKTLLTASLDTAFSYELDVEFIPLLVTDIDWKIDTSGIHILKGDIIASGVFNLDATANYNFTATGSYNQDFVFDVFKKKWTSVYWVGEVPVYQEITYTLGAHLQANALTAIKARADANAFQSITFGVRYNPSTGAWEPIANESHYDSLTASLNVKGEVDSEIRLIPNLEVKFYKIVAANLSIESIILGKIEEEGIANADFLNGYFPPGTIQFTAFDFSLNEQCFVGANLQIISKEFPLLSKTEVCNFPGYKIFSLPTLQLNSVDQGSGVYSLTADIKDGDNDPFNDASIKWILYPDTAGTLNLNGRQATFTPSAAPTSNIATIFFSGYGKLGESGRQFVQAKIPLGFVFTVNCIGCKYSIPSYNEVSGTENYYSFLINQLPFKLQGIEYTKIPSTVTIYRSVPTIVSGDYGVTPLKIH